MWLTGRSAPRGTATAPGNPLGESRLLTPEVELRGVVRQLQEDTAVLRKSLDDVTRALQELREKKGSAGDAALSAKELERLKRDLGPLPPPPIPVAMTAPAPPPVPAAAVAAAQTTTSIGALGNTTTTITGNEALYGALSGFANSANRMAAFYERQLESLVPAVYVPSGLTGSAVIQGGVTLDGVELEHLLAHTGGPAWHGLD